MRSLFFSLVFVVAGFATVAVADSLVTTQLNGSGLQVFQAGPLAKVSFQCPRQAVYYRPSGCAGCVIDAGPAADGGVGDYIADFNFSPDPVGPIFMSPGDTQLVVANVDGGAVGCSFARESP